MFSNSPQHFETVDKIDLYSTIHKGLRRALFHALQGISVVDASDEEALDEALHRLFTVMKLASRLADIENTRIYEFLDSVCPGAVDAGRADFERQTVTFARLVRLERDVRVAAPGEREQALAALVATFSAFAGEVLLHQSDSEAEIMPLLRDAATAEQLMDIQKSIFADLGGDAFVLLAQEIALSVGGRERVAFFSLVQRLVSASVWSSVWRAASSLLPAHEQSEFARLFGAASEQSELRPI